MSYQSPSLRDNFQEDVKPNLADIKFSFAEDQQEKIQERLNEYLTKDDISKRSAFGGNQVSYLEGWKTFEIANQIFGFNGWSTTIRNSTVDFLDVNDGKFSVGISTIIRVTLKDGSFHEDVGYGTMENSKSKGQAFEKARKESVTDAVKRALRFYGNSLGNCLYDKQFLKKTANAPAKGPQGVGMNGNPSNPTAFGFNNAQRPHTNGFGCNSNPIQNASRPNSFQAGSNTNPLNNTFRPGASNQTSHNMNPLQNTYRPVNSNQFSPGISSNTSGTSTSHGTYPIKNEVLTPAQKFNQSAQPVNSVPNQPQSSCITNNGTSAKSISVSSNFREDSFDLDDESLDQITTESLSSLNKTSNNNQTGQFVAAVPSTSSSNQFQNAGSSFANNNMGSITMAPSFITSGSLKVASPIATRAQRPPPNQNSNPGDQALDNLPDPKRHRGF